MCRDFASREGNRKGTGRGAFCGVGPAVQDPLAVLSQPHRGSHPSSWSWSRFLSLLYRCGVSLLESLAWWFGQCLAIYTQCHCTIGFYCFVPDFVQGGIVPGVKGVVLLEQGNGEFA